MSLDYESSSFTRYGLIILSNSITRSTPVTRSDLVRLTHKFRSDLITRSIALYEVTPSVWLSSNRSNSLVFYSEFPEFG